MAGQPNCRSYRPIIRSNDWSLPSTLIGWLRSAQAISSAARTALFNIMTMLLVSE
jgi:hypothetical protein